MSENIEIELVFQFKAFFHLTSRLHISLFSAFKSNLGKLDIDMLKNLPRGLSRLQG